jgi:hypothetical protein
MATRWMISESRVPDIGMPGLMGGDWKRSTVSGPQRLQLDAWTAPDLSATARALDSTPWCAMGSLPRGDEVAVAHRPAHEVSAASVARTIPEGVRPERTSNLCTNPGAVGCVRFVNVCMPGFKSSATSGHTGPPQDPRPQHMPGLQSKSPARAPAPDTLMNAGG